MKTPTESFAPSSPAPGHSPILARIRARLGEGFPEHGPERAVEELTRFLTSQPNHVGAYVLRAEVLANWIDDKEGALADLDKALALNPEEGQAYLLRGKIRAEGRPELVEAGLADLDKAVRLGPDFSCASRERAMSLFQRGRYREADEELTRGLSLKGSARRAGLLRTQVVARLRVGNYEGMVLSAELWKEEEPRGARYSHLALAIAHEGLGRSARALREVALVLNDEAPGTGIAPLEERQAHFLRGRLCVVDKARLAEGLRSLRNAVTVASFDPNNTEAIYPALFLSAFGEEVDLGRFSGEAFRETFAAKVAEFWTQAPPEAGWADRMSETPMPRWWVRRDVLCKAYTYEGLRAEKARDWERAKRAYARACAFEAFELPEYRWSLHREGQIPPQ